MGNTSQGLPGRPLPCSSRIPPPVHLCIFPPCQQHLASLHNTQGALPPSTNTHKAPTRSSSSSFSFSIRRISVSHRRDSSCRRGAGAGACGAAARAAAFPFRRQRAMAAACTTRRVGARKLTRTHHKAPPQQAQRTCGVRLLKNQSKRKRQWLRISALSSSHAP